ncbi:LysR family transcriptional regulator [Anaerovibrio sp. JC8]|uniref:LysR family transcriptional regulator n=1 Tax=Anaerovibrio sp. JC8 TaxID=1240085 RepID=UPI000A108B7E|nr:LysR family transcriptional regulator [Anaerovibrio sp. JC8]
MELRVLNYFLTVAKEGNFSRAAEKLHLSQPTLSRQIKDMEEEYGKILLIREPRRIILTDDGELLRRRAEEILSLVDKTEGELLSNERSISGDIRIGAGESPNFALIMEIAKEIRQHYPGIHFHIISGDGETTKKRLDLGLIDFGYLYGHLDSAKYTELSLPVQDRWVLLLQHLDPLAKKDFIAPEDLWEKPLLFSRQSLSPGVHGDYLLDWLKKPLDELNIKTALIYIDIKAEIVWLNDPPNSVGRIGKKNNDTIKEQLIMNCPHRSMSSCVVFIEPCNWAIGATNNKADSRSVFLTGFS